MAEGGTVGGGQILRIVPGEAPIPIIAGLPSRGDHHTNGPAFDEQGALHFSVGTATNSGVVGEDNFEFGWLERHPDFHDLPCESVTLAGENYDTGNPLSADDLDMPDPPKPAALLAVHSASSGLDFSHSADFGHVGEAFIAQLGDMAPGVGETRGPVGFKVIRVNVETGVIEDFAVNRGKSNGPGSFLGSGGLERPVAARFDPTGSALYVVDFGVIRTSADGPMSERRTGMLWSITRGEP